MFHQFRGGGRGGRGGHAEDSNQTSGTTTQAVAGSRTGGFGGFGGHAEDSNQAGDTNTQAFAGSRTGGFGGRGGYTGHAENSNQAGGNSTQAFAGSRGAGFGGRRGFGGHAEDSNQTGDNNTQGRGAIAGDQNEPCHFRGLGTGANAIEGPAGEKGAFSGFGQSRNAGFGEDQGNRPPINNYIPRFRTVEDLYKEDADHAENYRQIAEGDEEITVSGMGITTPAVLGDWKDAHFEDRLYKNIVEGCKYIQPRKIQAYAIPLITEGRDIKGHSETGSGKTGAFLLPIIDAIMKMNRKIDTMQKPSPVAIIIEPTRELCAQVYEQGQKFADGTGVMVTKAYGQFSVRENIREIQTGCDILVVTVGRLKHFVYSNIIKLDLLKFLVLDEADTLLMDTFLDDVRELLSSPGFPNKEDRQTMFFSATFPEMVQRLSMDVLKDNNVMVSNKKPVAANSKIKQLFIPVSREEKKNKLWEILESEIKKAKEDTPDGPHLRRTLVFVRTKRDSDLLTIYLTMKKVKATNINGDRSQFLREKALSQFRMGEEILVLVSTDVCARGIDVKDLDHVINFDLPSDDITYVHRIGRTGRLRPGLATSFFDEYDSNDINIAKSLAQFLIDAGQEVPEFLAKAAAGESSGDNWGGDEERNKTTADDNAPYNWAGFVESMDTGGEGGCN